MARQPWCIKAPLIVGIGTDIPSISLVGENRMQASVARWGNSLGVRVPKEIAARIGLREGSRVEVTTEGDRIVLTVRRPLYKLEELLAGMTPDAMHEAFDWGKDRGRERVERRPTSLTLAT